MGRQDVSHQSVDDGSQQNAADVVSMAHEVANRKCTLQAVAQHVPVRPLELDSVHGSMTPSPIRTREGVNIDRATSREDQDVIFRLKTPAVREMMRRIFASTFRVCSSRWTWISETVVACQFKFARILMCTAWFQTWLPAMASLHQRNSKSPATCAACANGFRNRSRLAVA